MKNSHAGFGFRVEVLDRKAVGFRIVFVRLFGLGIHLLDMYPPGRRTDALPRALRAAQRPDTATATATAPGGRAPGPAMAPTAASALGRPGLRVGVCPLCPRREHPAAVTRHARRDVTPVTSERRLPTLRTGSVQQKNRCGPRAQAPEWRCRSGASSNREKRILHVHGKKKIGRAHV